MSITTVFSRKLGDEYRIPALANADGTLVAVADNGKTGKDWGYIELTVSTSGDGGETWSEPRIIASPPARVINSDEANTKTAFFIDPCLGVAPNGDLILLVTFFPECKGCHDMKLLEKKKISYASFDGQSYPIIYDREGNFYYILSDGTVLNKTRAKTDFRVEGIGELYKGDEYIGNIYLNGAKGKADSENKTTHGAPLKAPKRSYIYMFTSSDKGESWTEPKDITPLILSEDDEAFLGIAPGSALTTSTGRMIFPLYSEKGTVCIYTDDNGKSWMRNRRIAYTGNKGEWTAFELPDNSIYAYGRDNGKVPATVSNDNGITWIKGEKPKFKAPKCQKSSAVVGDRVLVSHPSGKKRENGVLSVGQFIYDKHGRYKGIEWKNDIKINTGFFAYSCVVPMGSNTAGVLYEVEESGNIAFQKIRL